MFTTSALTKNIRKRLPQLYKDTHLLWSMFYWHQSWYGNKMIPLRFLLSFVFLSNMRFFQKLLNGACFSLSCLDLWQSLNKFYESSLAIFWNKVLSVIKTVNNHTVDIKGLEMQFYLIVVWFHLKLCIKKEADCFGWLWQRRIWLDYVQLLFWPFLVCNLVHTYKFRGNLKTAQ